MKRVFIRYSLLHLSAHTMEEILPPEAGKDPKSPTLMEEQVYHLFSPVRLENLLSNRILGRV